MPAKVYATKRLKQIREDLGHTQKEFASLLTVEIGREITLPIYQKWELGIRPIEPSIALEIAKKYKLDLQDIVERR